MLIGGANAVVFVPFAQHINTGIHLKAGPVPLLHKRRQYIKLPHGLFLPFCHMRRQLAVVQNLSGKRLYVHHNGIDVSRLALRNNLRDPFLCGSVVRIGNLAILLMRSEDVGGSIYPD